MSGLQFPLTAMDYNITRVDRTYRPFWLTSDAYLFPKFAIMDRNLSKRVAIILYYANIMNQKKLLKDFLKVCQDNLKDKNNLEISLKTWIKHSLVKLHRRREQIISIAVSTFQTEMIRTISHILFSILKDTMQESDDQVHSLNSIISCKKSTSCPYAQIQSLNEECLLNCFNFKDFFAGWEQLHLHLNSRGNNSQVSIYSDHSMNWLQKFWLKFCYQPNPKSFLYEIALENDFTDLENEDCDSNVAQASLCESDDGSWSLSTQMDSDSSGSWSCRDFADDVSDNEVAFNPIRPHEKSNSTLKWLQSTSIYYLEQFDSDEDSFSFGDVITEENCLDCGVSNGSLHFIDTDDDSDDFVMFSDASAISSFSFESYEDKSQGCYANPCFEEEFSLMRGVPKYIRILNESWSEMMLDIKDKPRKASKVSFAPDTSLVTVHHFEKSEENSIDHTAILDRLRFSRRIYDLNYLLTPFLTTEHREYILRRNGFYHD